MRRRSVVIVAALAACSAAIAQPASPRDGLEHWPPAERAAFAALDRTLVETPRADRLLAWHQLLGEEPHVAGSEGDARVIEKIENAFREMGLEVQRHEFWALLAKPVAAELEIVGTPPVRLSVREDMLMQDAPSRHPNQNFGWNAYSGSGEVEAEVVYVNYGTKADFARLRAMGVETTGRIAIARYGGNFRGYKAKFAEAAGCVGLIIYTDPADSGYAKGIPYPEGGYSNSSCIERGSLSTLGYAGDPLTPGVEATRDAKRLDEREIDLPRIPVQPIGYGSAAKIMERMTGAGVPEGWQGGLPFAYRLTGGDGLRVRLKVEQTRAIVPTANVIATLRGTTEADKKVVIGCHHDAWGCGAADPLAGTIALMESARAFAEAAKAGHRPRRTLVFAAWGAEEFGIIGSTEWVEANRDNLIAHGVAYFNLDMASMGPNFAASGSPSLRRVLFAAAGVVPQARAKAPRTVLDDWLSRAADERFPGMPRVGSLGGGSDHIGFLCHVSVASASISAGGSRGNAYHSTYDTLPWYWKVVGEDYEPALLVTRMTTAAAARLAYAPLLPLDPSDYGPEAQRHLSDLGKRAVELGLWSRENEPAWMARLGSRAEAYRARALAVRGDLLAALDSGRLSGQGLAGVNRLLMAGDRAFLDEDGMPGRPWFRSLFVANDEDSGYASWMLPGLRRAIEQKDPAAAEEAAGRLIAAFKKLETLSEAMAEAVSGDR
ncbi:MAG: M20/M25/M40 family metallo-hydrolase [Phycisphaerae bacterium]|nr:M20/M25/M40 family metallo-hydrolase [Phycisphaerae bacterium]